jgi:hypothetical protein
MSQIKVDQITDEAGTGAPDFPNGLTGSVPAASIAGALNATGDAPIYACRAWVNFNGTGTVAIRASGNVSSITDNGVGDYTVNFTTAMPDTNYSVTAATGAAGGGYPVYLVDTVTTSSFRCAVYRITGTLGAADTTTAMLSIFR